MSQEIQITSRVKTSKYNTTIQYDFSNMQSMSLNNAYQYTASLNTSTYTQLSTASFQAQYISFKNMETASAVTILLGNASNASRDFAVLKGADSIVVPHSGSNGYWAKSNISASNIQVVIIGN